MAELFRNLCRAILEAARRLGADRRGATAVFIALGIIPLIAVVGISVDGARGYLVKSRLSQALDAAALAGGRVMSSPNRDADIEMYFEANFPPGFMDATVSGPHIDADSDAGIIALDATATIPTAFMRVVGIDTVTVRADTVVKRADRAMELVLVMDNTGSMGWGSNTKMTKMKEAATILVNKLFGDRETVPNFLIGLVPYTATVNIGNDHTDWIMQESENPDDYLFDPDDYGTVGWKGCVEARPLPYEEAEAEALPSVRRWTAFYWRSTADEEYYYRGDELDDDEKDNSWPPIKQASSYQDEARGPNLGCGPAITPLQPNKSVALDAVDEMESWGRGGTMGNLGLAWGWRVLSPTWRGMWGAQTPATAPVDYDTPYVDKVVVMLTDGVNQWFDYPDHAPGCAGYDWWRCDFPDADYTAYGRLSEGRLGTTDGGAATDIINDRMTDLCTAMKAENIIIYTIVLQVNNSATQDLYRDCASRPEFYFSAPDKNELAGIFTEIADQLANLRLAR